jgi:hypothetical protein
MRSKFVSKCAETGKSIDKGALCMVYDHKAYHEDFEYYKQILALRNTEALGLADGNY